MAPSLEALANNGEKFRLIKVDVARWGSPVAEQFGLNSLPSFMIYNDKGKLQAQGEAARQLVYGQYLSGP